MGELTKEDVKEIVETALTNFAADTLSQIVREAMIHKIEFTFGVDCTNPENRKDLRNNMEFVTDLRKDFGDEIKENLGFVSGLRKKTREGGEKVFITAAGVCGAGFIYWFVSKVWPEGTKYFHP